MNVLLCTPYLSNPQIVSGGINIWGRNIVSYYKTLDTDVFLTPVSFDRKFNVREDSSIFSRAVWGIRDYFYNIKNMRVKLKDCKYDVIHICTSAQLSLIKDLFIFKFCLSRNIKKIIHLHFGRIPELFEIKNWEYYILKTVCNLADRIIVMDKESYDVLKKHGYMNVYYLPNPISNEILETVDSNMNIINNIPNKVLYVGHVIPSKGVFELVQACKDINDLELHLVGSVDKKIKEELQNIASINNQGSFLQIRGEMDHSEVIKEMLSAGIFVLPSYTEGFPNVILEAMACCCPIVATAVGAIPEMLCFTDRNMYGICVKPKDVIGLKNAILEMRNNRVYAKMCGQNARTRVINEYSMSNVWHALVSIWSC